MQDNEFVLDLLSKHEDHLRCRIPLRQLFIEYNNMTLPKWANDVFPKKLMGITMLRLRHTLPPFNTFVKILYKNIYDDVKDPFTSSLPGCDTYCPLNTFTQLIRNVPRDDHLKVE